DITLWSTPLHRRITPRGPRVEVDARLLGVELVVLILYECDLSDELKDLRIAVQAAFIRPDGDLGAAGEHDIRLGQLQVDVIVVVGRLNGAYRGDVEAPVLGVDAGEARVLHRHRLDLLRRLFGLADVDPLDDRVDARPGDDQSDESERDQRQRDAGEAGQPPVPAASRPGRRGELAVNR